MPIALSSAEEEQLRTHFAAITVDTADTSKAGAVASADLRELFCENWDMVRRLLQFIADLPVTPGLVRTAISLVIKAGDVAKATLCK